MKIEPRAKHCPECPYLEENKECLDQDQYENIVENKAIFPCHMELKKVVGSDNSGVEIYVAKVETFVVCRGRAEEIGMIR